MDTPQVQSLQDNGNREQDVDKIQITDDDEDDNDVVIMDEKEVEEAEKAATHLTLSEISKAIEEAKEIAKQTEKEIEYMSRELENMQCNLSDTVYKSLQFLVNNPKCQINIPIDEPTLDKMINSVLESLQPEDCGDLTENEYHRINDKLTLLERANQSVSKLFLDCHAKLKQFKQGLLAETAEVESNIGKFEKTMSETTLLIDSDDEDASAVSIIKSSKAVPQSQEQNTRSGKTTAPSAVSPLHPQLQSALESPSLEQLRSNFVSAVHKSMPNLISSLQNQQSYAEPQAQTQTSQDSQTARSTTLQTAKWPELKVSDKVLGKKFNDVWYSGTILDIYPPSEGIEWRCKVKFDGKGQKVLPGKHVAYREPITFFIRVGTRVVALYREDDAPSSFYAGVIAEAPSIKNNRRFLVFFDDGYAQYCDAKELHKVYMQSENVWEDINPDTSAFIKEYLRIYPERPMVRLSKGQVVRTEWNGKWWTAKVQETDASLVKMYFQADKRTEWLYRGSTRLEPLFRALANADAIKTAGSAKGRRHNLNMRPSDDLQKPSVEYTRGAVDEDSSSSSKAKSSGRTSEATKKKSNVAKKSTGGSVDTSDASKSGQWEAPWIKYQRKATPGSQRSLSTDSASQDSDKTNNREKRQSHKEGNNKSSKDIASVLQERLAQVEYDEEQATGERREIMLDTKDRVRVPYTLHECGPKCVEEYNDLDKFKGRSSHLKPLLCGWERQVCKMRPTSKRYVIYRSPCGRRLRNLAEVDNYLYLTDSQLTIDLFCFDQQLHVNTEFVPVKTFCDIKDMSYGKENVPISCVNGVDRHYPDYLEYSVQRTPSTGVNLNLDPDFLVCCDCTDNCRDRSKCACQQMTIQNTSCIGEVDPDAGYLFKRLPEPLFTGIVECNSRCQCDRRCANRVAQHGLTTRLQVFKTEKKGWGLRCLDDIAKGSFICIYAGQLLTDKGANEDGKTYGDEYLAELDFIEVVERQKEGYESDVEIDFSDEDNNAKESDDDSDYMQTGSPPDPNSHRKLRKRKAAQEKAKKSEEETKIAESAKEDTTVSQPINISDDEDDEEEDESESKKEKKEEKPETDTIDITKKLRSRAKKSTGGSRFNLSTTYHQGQEPVPEKAGAAPEKKERIPTRMYFRDDTECYIMDAKSMGNLGRYLNHSCSPNVFVQNIFVDTHDLRFPWVAFFAGQYIRAGTELTWDYNYEVGSVPDKVLYCYCGSATCRGRLL
ncbi:histone-lysine N-methyltransferase SETDB1-B-like isoform X2 [Physella acuta]|uniref:histone-lysine N-methyltransferase SETDB1-B-like isoform X2 n=1 Tax=Physella acuta TaxID=109671 RepID=UPI0027DC1AD1|nr:histone-lysine N-methyltransferase SETDB1-B-like isoform X2 [Physella acuta]